MPEESTHVAVVGGGVIGCAVAWTLARRGVAVTVIERDTPGRGATWAAGGMLSPLGEADRPGPFLDLALASFRRFPAFAEAAVEASGVDVEYRTGGKLHVALDEAEAGRLSADARWKREHGFDVELVSGEEARRLEPALAPDVRAALHIASDHRLDNRRLGRALWIAADRAGAACRLGTPAVRLVVDGTGGGGAPGVRGVALADGSVVEAERVVVAAGCWSGRLQGLPRPLPVRPVRGQMVALDTVPPALRRVVASPGCYLIPRADGRVIVGSTVERAGFRPHPTAAGVASLTDAALRTAPALAEAPVAEIWAGLRPGTPDGLPILGADPEVDGLVYATGHFRNGILLAPITAEAVADLITDAAAPVAIDAFAPDRDLAPAE